MTPMIPTFLYGTAWKEDETERCVRLAIWHFEPEAPTLPRLSFLFPI